MLNATKRIYWLFVLSSPWLLSAQDRVIVDSYEPAPGQFVNVLPVYEEGDDAIRMAEKCTQTLADGGLITLGAWGGSITFHLEHPVINVIGQKDLYLKGNAYAGSSEPGIVQVSVDANGNGLSDDAWYEIQGSAEGNVTTYGYQLTYTHPATLSDIPWTDAEGNTGCVERNAFHSQDYFPLWMPDTLTYTGTLLPPNGHDLSGQGSYWVTDAFEYGYVDNVANSDTIGCSIDLSWAVDPVSREAVTLTHADFIRVYCAERQQCGWLGETSTEFCGAMDLHAEAVMGVHETRIVSDVTPKEIPFLPKQFRRIGRKIVTIK